MTAYNNTTTLITLTLLCLCNSITNCQAWVTHNTPSVSKTSTTHTRQGPPPAATATHINPQQTHVLVLPGFATAASDYVDDLVPNIAQQAIDAGWWSNDNNNNNSNNNSNNDMTNAMDHIHVLPLQRHDWAQIIAFGMCDLDFMTFKAPATNWAYRWYLQKVAKEVKRIQDVAKEEGTTAKIILVGHSAGGWLARAAVGYGMDDTNGKDLQIDIDSILGIVTLGSPHIPCPKGSVDITGGALRIVHDTFPGAFFNDRLFYVSAAGSALNVEQQQAHIPSPHTITSQPDTDHMLAYQSYKLLSGQGHQDGDGIVPVPLAHLEGSNLQITLDNVYHTSMLQNQHQHQHEHDQHTSPTSEASESRWYGSKDIVQQWFSPVLHKVLPAMMVQ